MFNSIVTGFATGDVTLGGTAGGTLVGTVTGSGTTYNVAVTGMTGSGTVVATVGAGVAIDTAGNPNLASTSTDNTVTWDNVAPSVTINQAVGQADPTNATPINFTVVFSESVANFVTGDVTFAGTSGGTKVGTVTGSGTTYNVAVTGMTTSGTVIATIIAGRATDAAGNNNTASTSTDNTVTWDVTPPTVTINQAVGQADPTNTSPINFTVVFNEAVTGFATGDVTITGHLGRDEDRHRHRLGHDLQRRRQRHDDVGHGDRHRRRERGRRPRRQRERGLHLDATTRSPGMSSPRP